MENYAKSDENSKRLREIGNKFYTQRQFFEAIIKYNESLCYAENESENISLAYANRSAVYFEMKLYQRSLENIELARTHNYPIKNLEVLKIREEKCRDLMKNGFKESQDMPPFKLTYDPHKKYPSMANCLELKSDKKFGRYIITNKSLSVGDVIAIEQPVVNFLREEFLYQRCSHCLKSNILSLLPCNSCTRAMFCSDSCAKNAINNYHRYECPVSKLITTSFLNANMQMALRTFLMALTTFDDSVESLVKYLNENRCNTVFDFNGDANIKNRILAVNSLIHDDAIDVNDMLFGELFQVDEKLKKLWMSNKNDILKFLRKHTQIASLNYHEIYGWPLKKGGLYDPELENFKKSLAYRRGVNSFASGSFLVFSLVNHSCAPNISKVFMDDKIVMVVQRPITAGSQIFDNYGYSFTNIPYDVRQNELLKQYRFVCNCEACCGNFNLLPSLKIIDKNAFRHAKKNCQELPNLNQKKSKQKFRELAEILQKTHQNFPSLEFCSLTESFQACLEIMLKPEILFP